MLDDVPLDVRPELAERYRQLRPFDLAEMALLRSALDRPDRVRPREEAALRWALALARLWILETPEGPVVVGPELSSFRDAVRPFARHLATGARIAPGRLGADAERLRRQTGLAVRHLLTTFPGRLSPKHLDAELKTKSLVLALGGGGGCGYVHLGTFALLEELGLRPSLIVGASMGALVGLFRARDHAFREPMMRAVTRQLSYKRMLRPLDAETRYSMPGAMRLHLRSTLGRFFVSPRGETMRMDDLDVPFVSVSSGLRREAMRNVQRYERLFLSQLRRGVLSRLLHVKELVQNLASLLQDLRSQGALTPVALGHDPETMGFDVIDAVGFSAAVPGLLQYDITRDDPRMHGLMRDILDAHGVDVLADGGLVANVPARVAWEHVQLGRTGKRNALILGLDCFAPQMGRNLVFLPLQRVAAQTVARDRPFAHVWHRYHRLPAATAVVPNEGVVNRAFSGGRADLAPESALLKKALAPLPGSCTDLAD